MLCPQPQPQLPNAPDDDGDDDDDDDNDTSLPSSTPETGPYTASSSIDTAAVAGAAVPSTSNAGVSSKCSKKKAFTPDRDLDIVQLLLQHQERSLTAAGELHQLGAQAAGPTNNKSAQATFLHSNLPSGT